MPSSSLYCWITKQASKPSSLHTVAVHWKRQGAGNFWREMPMLSCLLYLQRIIKWFWLERTLKTVQIQSLCGHGHFSLDQIAQSLVEPHSDHTQGTKHPQQPVLMPHHSVSEECILTSNLSYRNGFQFWNCLCVSILLGLPLYSSNTKWQKMLPKKSIRNKSSISSEDFASSRKQYNEIEITIS